MGGTTTPEAGGVPAIRKMRDQRDAILAGLAAALDKILVMDDARNVASVTFAALLVARDAEGHVIASHPEFDLTKDVSEQVKVISESYVVNGAPAMEPAKV